MRSFFITTALLLISIPHVLFAQTSQEFVPLVGIPGVDPESNLEGYINALFVIAIGVAGVLAVIKLIMAGVSYMFSEIPSVKSDAKGDITGALLGLLLILASVTILRTINPNITRFDVLRSASPLQVDVVAPANTADEGNDFNQIVEPPIIGPSA